MKNKSFIVGTFLVLGIAVCVSAYAADAQTCPVSDFFAGVGGFVYNSLPWNWGNWMGK